MVRLMGAARVAAGGAALGFQAAAGLRKRVRALEEDTPEELIQSLENREDLRDKENNQ